MKKREKETAKKRQKLSRIVGNNLFVLGKIFRFTPDYIIWMVIEGVVWGLINSVQAMFSYYLFNALDAGAPFTRILRIVGFMAGFYLLAYFFDRFYWVIQNTSLKQKLHLRMHEELFRRAQAADLACFDDPAFYNDFVWAMNESDNRAAQVVETTGKLINRLVGSATLFGLLATIDIWVAVALFAASVFYIVLNQLANKLSYEQDKECNPLWRKNSYLKRVYYMADYAKEIRMTHVSDLLLAEYDENNQKIVDVSMRYGKKYFRLYGVAYNLVSSCSFFGILIYMFFRLVQGHILLGGFAAAMYAVWQVTWLFTDLIDRLTQYQKHSLYIEKYRAFLHFTPRVVGGERPVEPLQTLELCGVSFSYAFDDHPKYEYHEDKEEKEREETEREKIEGRDVLKNVSFTIRRGEKIALVGYNGAGKTTLIKLLMRFYDPTEGQILYNGHDLREYRLDELRARIGTVFQDYKIFATSIAENVMNGICEESDRETVEVALAAADFTEKLSALKEGMDTHLTREFNDAGTNLSGGEAQKIAIARAFARPYDLLIMDEPSSALDPLAEYTLNRSIMHNAVEKTVVFISHRLSTTREADRIYMFDDGHLIESGSHDELIAAKGKYAEMFNLQAEKYRQGG